MLKPMTKVKALSRLAGGNPHGCNVGIYNQMGEAVAQAAALFAQKGHRRRKMHDIYHR